MNIHVIAGLFALLEAILMAGQITTLVSTYWTSWNLRFNWTEGRDYGRGPPTEGQLISEGHAGLWSRCLRIYDTKFGDDFPPFNCLQNYNSSNGSIRYDFGKACKIATAALCVGDSALIVVILIIVLMSACRAHRSMILARVSLPLLMLQGLICFSIPLTYLSGNMAELIQQLSTAYGLLHIIRMTTWYKHDWAFWTQVGLVAVWIASVAVYILFYSIKYARTYPRRTKASNGGRETIEDTELEALKS